MEGVHVSNILKSIAVVLDNVDDDGFDIFTLDKFKEFKASRIKEIVPRHCFVDDVKNGFEETVLSDLLVVEFIL